VRLAVRHLAALLGLALLPGLAVAVTPGSGYRSCRDRGKAGVAVPDLPRAAPALPTQALVDADLRAYEEAL